MWVKGFDSDGFHADSYKGISAKCHGNTFFLHYKSATYGVIEYRVVWVWFVQVKKVFQTRG